MSVASSVSSTVLRPRLADGVVRSKRRSWVTRNGLTQLYNLWRRPSLEWNTNGSDSDSGGSWDTSVNEDEVDFSISSETLGFDWVEHPDDVRNYALFVNKRFYEDAVAMESTLNQRIDTMETEFLLALGGVRLRASPSADVTVITAFDELRVELEKLFRDHRTLFTC